MWKVATCTHIEHVNSCMYCVLYMQLWQEKLLRSFTLRHALKSSATAYYCSQTPIKMWLAWRDSVINKIKLSATCCSWTACCSYRLTMTDSLFFLISSTAQMFICSAADILSLHYYINTQRCHYTINTKGLFRGTACRHVFVFLNGPQNVELHKSLMGSPSSMLFVWVGEVLQYLK